MRKNTLTGCQQDLLDYLGKQYTVKRIDGLDCIYRDFGDYDVEVCGGRTIRARFHIFVWKTKGGYEIVHRFMDLPHSLPLIAELLQLIARLYAPSKKEASYAH